MKSLDTPRTALVPLLATHRLKVAAAAFAAEIATLLAGGTVPECGDGIANGDEQCDTADLAGATCESLGYTLGGALACGVGCGFDTSGCASQQLPATGQVTASGPGSDGDVQAGAPLSYTDNGDGTITDNNTGLMWEKKDDNPTPTIHDVDSQFTWSTVFDGDMDGTIKTVFLDTLNDVAGGGANCFAGYCDWRIPNVKELYGIVDLERVGNSIDPVFDQPGCTGCTDVTLATCSCTKGQYYWSSTKTAHSINQAWQVVFYHSYVNIGGKGSPYYVRAVRGGL